MAIKYEDIKQANDAMRTTTISHKDKKTGKTVSKEYMEVNQRIKAFRMVYPEGFIKTEMVSNLNGICIFKAMVGFMMENGMPNIIGTGTAYEKETSSFINQTSYIENCVPLHSQILTRDGWKFYYQLNPGEDEVYALNLETGKMDFCNLLDVVTYKDHPIVSMESSRFKVKCTPEHKWIAKTQYKGLTKVATKDLTVSWKIVQAVSQDVKPSVLGRKLGWLMCDCDSVYVRGMISTSYISQSKYVDDIRELFGDGRLCKKFNNEWLDNYEWIVSADESREILGQFGMATYKDLPKAMLNADIEDVAGCFDSMMKADGDARGFSSTYPELIEAMQIMCARLGIATTFVKSRMMKGSTRPIHTLSIKKTDGAWFSELKVKNMPPQDVWCPKTEFGTWVMRQDGFVTLTSNCETSAVGRALGMAGFGIDTSVASADEVQNAIANQTDERKATPKQIEWLKKVYTGDNLAKLLKSAGIDKLEEMPMRTASELIEKIQGGKKNE